jgi:Ferritin-like domain
VLDAEAQRLVDRFVEDHTAHIDVVGRLIADAGGEPYECANTWYIERTVDPIFTQITGDEAQDIAPSDDPARDLMTVSNGWESMMGATYQEMAEVLTTPELRANVMKIGVEEARQAAAMAMQATGTPEGYVSPALFGEAPTPDETGLFKAFAIPTRFGSLAANEVVVGARSEAGTRQSFTLETPADNSLIYEGMTCQT